MKPKLTIERLKSAAADFCNRESTYSNEELYGKTDGKAIGTHIERKFQAYLESLYEYDKGSVAKGIDFPGDDIQTDIKVTSIKQPQSSCTFQHAEQKIFGLGYHLLVFVYEKTDDASRRTAVLDFVSCSFIEKSRTADYTMTSEIGQLLKNGANKEEIIAYLKDKNLPADEIELDRISDRLLSKAPEQGYLILSNALQWRLQYTRVVGLTDEVSGIHRLVDKGNQ